MSLCKIGSCRAVSASPEASVAEIVRTMEQHNVGSVVIVAGGKPVGIVTDRDLTLRVLGKGKDPAKTAVGAVMTQPVLTAPDWLEPLEAAGMMRDHGVRRLPVVRSEGLLEGMVTLDDLVYHMGRTGGALSETLSSLPIGHRSA
jgi:CBS domain-containing protein